MARLMALLCLFGLVGACELDNADRRPLPCRGHRAPDLGPLLTGAFVILTIGSTDFRPAEPNFSPIVGRIPAVAGETYRLTILPGGTDHDFNVPFVLTTSLER